MRMGRYKGINKLEIHKDTNSSNNMYMYTMASHWRILQLLGSHASQMLDDILLSCINQIHFLTFCHQFACLKFCQNVWMFFYQGNYFLRMISFYNQNRILRDQRNQGQSSELLQIMIPYRIRSELYRYSVCSPIHCWRCWHQHFLAVRYLHPHSRLVFWDH